MNRTSRIVLCLTAAAALACGGLSREVAAATVEDCLVIAGTLQDGPEKTSLVQWLETGFLAAHDGNVVLFEASSVKGALERAASDQVLSGAELIDVQRKGPSFAHHSPAATDSTLLADIRAKVASAPPPKVSFDDWDAGVLRARLESLGWSVASCDTDEDDFDRKVECDAAKGDLYATVVHGTYKHTDDAKWEAERDDRAYVRRRDGRAVLEVSVYDGAAGMALAEKLLSADPATPWTRDRLTSALEPDGWQVTSWSESTESDYRSVSADVATRDDEAHVSISEWADGEGESRSLQDGVATLSRGRTHAYVSLRSEAAAQALLDELAGG